VSSSSPGFGMLAAILPVDAEDHDACPDGEGRAQRKVEHHAGSVDHPRIKRVALNSIEFSPSLWSRAGPS
jgi:hypothetical protein